MTKKNTNISPYFDDYNEDKKFHRILFRPSYAVQARELTQAQTILQNQIERFGKHVFKNGSMVIPGQITYNNSIHYVKINTIYGDSEVDYESMIGFPISGGSTGVTGTVIHAMGETLNEDGTVDPVTLFVSFDKPGTDPETNVTTFEGSELLTVESDQGSILCTTIAGSEDNIVSGKSTFSFIENGVYYIDGFFVNVDSQLVVLEKYNIYPTYRVGLRKFETFITSDDDVSLTDNAQGYPNYAAPGADRLKIELILDKVAVANPDDPTSTDSEDDENFIELHRIVNGVLISETRRTEYNELEKTLARRTYDESGDYTVNPFIATIQEHYKDPDSPIYEDGKYVSPSPDPDHIPAGDKTKLIFHMDPGKAYVKGFEIETISSSPLETNKPRTTLTKYDEIIFAEMGNYIVLSDVTGFPELEAGTNNFGEINLVDVGAETIGTANIKFFYKWNTRYILGIFNVSMNSGKRFADVVTIENSGPSFTGTIDTDYGAMIFDVDKNTLIYPLQKSFVKNTLSSRLSYSVMRTIEDTAVDGGSGVGVIDISTNPGEVFNQNTSLIYIVDNLGNVVTTAGFTFGASTLTISGLAIGTTYKILYPIVKTARPRTKSFQKNVEITSTLVDDGTTLSLDTLDVYRIVSIVDNTTTRDITDRYIFDDGQRDNFYQSATIKRRKGVNPPKGTLTVTIDYFQWGATGDYFTANSYILSEDFGYEDIPSYNGTRLSDVVDFRIANSNLSTSTTELPVRNSYIGCSYEYYIGRIDYIVLKADGDFQIVEGVPSEFPKPPEVPADAMALYLVGMRPYCINKYSVDLRFIENKRYTMRDIGRLETRINNLEYYSTLNMLEKETSSFQIQDGDGLDRFKNGFIVDPFTSHGIGDIAKADYRCSIDRIQGHCRPRFISKSAGLEFNDDCISNSTGFRQTGPLITLDYTDVAFITQPFASRTENVNPHSVRLFKGKIDFTPDSDNWYDKKKVGEFIINNDAHYEALEFMASHGEGLDGTIWDDWNTDWTSVRASSSSEITKDVEKAVIRDVSRVHVGKIDASTESGLGWVGDKVTTSTKTTTVKTTTSGLSRDGVKISHSPTVINRDAGDRTVGINYIPYMREKYITGYASGLKPDSLVFPFFDGEDVTDVVSPCAEIKYTKADIKNWKKILHNKVVYGVTSGVEAFVRNVDPVTGIIYVNMIKPNGANTDFQANENINLKATKKWVATVETFDKDVANFGEPLYTDSSGSLAFLFHIKDGIWKTGERTFRLVDQPIDVGANNCEATGVFRSQGSILQTEGTVLSTKTINFTEKALSEKKVVSKTDVSVKKTTTSETLWYDPVAQTILIEEEGGCFVTAIDVFFVTKDKSLPVTCQLRTVNNGYPSTYVLPMGQVSLDPSQVETSLDASVPTRFTFPAPVYMEQNTEYCFVLLSDSFNYNIWISHLGDKMIDSDRLISSQPYLGVMFKSQNSSTWNATQEEDIKFTVYKAKFDTSGATVYFQNEELPTEDLKFDPILADPDRMYESYGTESNKLRVFHRSHGMSEYGKVILDDRSDGVTMSGTTTNAEGTGTIDLSTLKGVVHEITEVEFNSYVITPASGFATTHELLGDGVSATQDIKMDTCNVDIQTMVLTGTGISFEMVVPLARSVADFNKTQDAYTYGDSDFFGFIVGENITFNSPRAIYSSVNEEAFLSNYTFPMNKSCAVKANLSSINPNLSPVIDTDRMQIIGVSNLVDDFEVFEDVAFTATPNTDLIEITTTNVHNLFVGNWITISGATHTITPTEDNWLLNNSHQISEIVDADTFRIPCPGATISDGVTTTNAKLIYPLSRRKMYMPELESGGGNYAAKYMTRGITMANPSVAFTCMFAAVVMPGADIIFYYRTLGQYENEIVLDNKDFTDAKQGMEEFEAPNGDIITYGEVPKSSNLEDFRDYQITVETNEPFIEISAKLVMVSQNTSNPPIIKDFRLIVLGS